MCFFVHAKYPEAKVAKRDIVCYKVGFCQDGKFSPYYRATVYEYKLGELQPPIWLIEERGLCTKIEAGYHSYSSKKGLRAWLHDSVSFVKCIIPKGTKYYYNPDYREFVSETIIVQEFIEPPF